jgi:hypothetical protein
MDYNTEEIFQDVKILNNALITGTAGAVIKRGQLLTAGEAGAFTAWSGDFDDGFDAVSREDATIQAGGSTRVPVAGGSMRLEGIAAVNNIAAANLDKLRVSAFKAGIYLN